MRRRCAVTVVGEVRGPVIAAVDRDPGDWPARQRVLVTDAVAVDADTGPRRVVVDLSVGAEVDETVERSGVYRRAATHADGGNRAVASTVGRGPGAARGQVRADRVPLDVADRSGLGVVGAVQPVGAEEELVDVVLVQHERGVELRTVAGVDPVRDELVRKESGATVGHAVRRDAEVSAVDVAEVGRVDEHLPAVTAREVEPCVGGRRLALRPVVLGAAPDPCSGPAADIRKTRVRPDRGELRDLQVGPVSHAGGGRVDAAVEVLPRDVLQAGARRARRGFGGRAATTTGRVPDAAVIADEDVG